MKRFLATLLLVCTCAAGHSLLNAQAATDQATPWRFTLDEPGDHWNQPGFDASGWRTGLGGFGVADTPGAKVKTVWNTNEIWLRKSIEIAAVPDKAALLIHHDEDAEVYLNGERLAEFNGYLSEYQTVPLTQQQRSLIKQGENLLAVHCRQTRGGQYIDVLLVDADNLPKGYIDSPFDFTLTTTWGEKVTAQNAWAQYPRPAMSRDQWQNLNGNWDYAVTTRDTKSMPAQWDGEILVPFAIESKLSGVQRLLGPDEALWYSRQFEASPSEESKLKLNFEAVDYRCQVFINGRKVGEHIGGNDPFDFDITDAIRDGSNELVVRVEDETGGAQLRGKQTLKAGGIWYTRVSGIWQTVWLEQVPAQHITDLKITTDVDEGSITVRPIVKGVGAAKFSVSVDDGENVGEAEVAESLTITLQNPQLWSPDSPHLYRLVVSLLDENGQVIDAVESYAGIRSVGKIRDDQGNLRFTLNGKPIFHFGPLDQGWWPDGLLTPPSDAAMLSDIEYLKAAGFNMIRKHIKVEPRRYYYHCDKLGMMVWQDQVSGGANPPWTRLDPNPQDAQWSDADHQQFMVELERMISSLENHPSIVVWVPFNEAWGQHRTIDVGHWASKRDTSRLINVASGGNFWPAGDIVDHHSYPHPDFPVEDQRYTDFIKVIGEFGGHGYAVKDHLWDATRGNWGYGGLPKDMAEYKQRYAESIKRLNDFRKRGIAGGVYTQTTDVEVEINGLMTYDRRVIKIPAKELRVIHQPLYE